MHPNNKFVVSEDIFAPRLAYGPLDDWERLYREFLSCEFWQLLDVDPWLKTAGPSARGRRVLVPLVRRLLGHQGQLPADMLEWVELYQQLAKSFWPTLTSGREAVALKVPPGIRGTMA